MGKDACCETTFQCLDNGAKTRWWFWKPCLSVPYTNTEVFLLDRGTMLVLLLLLLLLLLLFKNTLLLPWCCCSAVIVLLGAVRGRCGEDVGWRNSTNDVVGRMMTGSITTSRKNKTVLVDTIGRTAAPVYLQLIVQICWWRVMERFFYFPILDLSLLR